MPWWPEWNEGRRKERVMLHVGFLSFTQHMHTQYTPACMLGYKTAGRRRRREDYTHQGVGEEDGGVGWPEVAGNLEEEEEKQKEE